LVDETILTKSLDNRTVLTEKGIWQYLQYIKPDELLRHRLLTGFSAKIHYSFIIYAFFSFSSGCLNKRSKGKVKYFQRRWFLMVSSKPLVINH